VATSRRRERELARRRFERRRQAEMERRAKAKRRRTVMGASVGTLVVLGGVVALVFVLASGNSTPSSAKSGSKPNASPSPSPSATKAPPAPKKCAAIKPDPPAKGEPNIPQVSGKVSTKLVTKDIKVGHGPAAKSGDAVQVKYVGVSCDTGKAFDASYTDPANSTTHSKVFPVTLGQGQVIPGWDQGLVGMKAGGVRELVIPASLAYGASGSPPAIQGNDTLIFVVTMVKV
jgi:peptidylprolyl isomerase